MHYFILFPSQLVGQWLDPGWMFKWIYNYLSTKPVDQMKDSSMMIWMEPKIQLVQKVGHTMFLINNLVISQRFCRNSTQGIKKIYLALPICVYLCIYYWSVIAHVIQWLCSWNCVSSMPGAASTNWGNIYFQGWKLPMLLCIMHCI